MAGSCRNPLNPCFQLFNCFQSLQKIVFPQPLWLDLLYIFLPVYVCDRWWGVAEVTDYSGNGCNGAGSHDHTCYHTLLSSSDNQISSSSPSTMGICNRYRGVHSLTSTTAVNIWCTFNHRWLQSQKPSQLAVQILKIGPICIKLY